jgi:hypothetical protein
MLYMYSWERKQFDKRKVKKRSQSGAKLSSYFPPCDLVPPSALRRPRPLHASASVTTVAGVISPSRRLEYSLKMGGMRGVNSQTAEMVCGSEGPTEF